MNALSIFTQIPKAQFYAGCALFAVAVGFAIRRFNRGCTCNENVDMKNKIVVITGGHAGLGYETTRGLALRGATVYVGCRDTEKGKKSINEIISDTGNSNIFVIELDLASFKSIRKFASEILAKNISVDILINNAGTWNEKEEKTVDGIDSIFGVNHLGHFLLTHLLLPRIRKSSGNARIITLSSRLHLVGKIDFDELTQKKKPSVSTTGYANSKLMNVLFSNELGRRLAGTGISTISLHPGLITTGMQQRTDAISQFFYYYIWRFLGKSAREGAQTSICAAISPKFNGKTSIYLTECAEAKAASRAYDVQLAKQLWELSEKLTQLSSEEKIPEKI